MPYFLSLNFLAVPQDVCSLHCTFPCVYILLLLRTLTVVFGQKKMSILFQFDSFIHLPLLFIKFYSSIFVLTFLVGKAFLGMAGEEVSFGNRLQDLSAVSN